MKITFFFCFFFRITDIHVGEQTQRISFYITVSMPGNISDTVPKADVENAIRWDFALWGKKPQRTKQMEGWKGKQCQSQLRQKQWQERNFCNENGNSGMRDTRMKTIMTERKQSIYQMVSWTTPKVKCFRGLVKLPKHISLHHTLPADLIAQTLTGTILYPEIRSTVMMYAHMFFLSFLKSQCKIYC